MCGALTWVCPCQAGGRWRQAPSRWSTLTRRPTGSSRRLFHVGARGLRRRLRAARPLSRIEGSDSANQRSSSQSVAARAAPRRGQCFGQHTGRRQRSSADTTLTPHLLGGLSTNHIHDNASLSPPHNTSYLGRPPSHPHSWRPHTVVCIGQEQRRELCACTDTRACCVLPATNLISHLAAPSASHSGHFRHDRPSVCDCRRADG